MQNCPDPKVIEPAYVFAISACLFSNAFGKIITGLILPISAKTGIGSSLFAAKSNKALPPRILPVKPTAFTFGCETNCCPTSIPLEFKLEKTPFGIPVFCAAFTIADATNAPVPACIGWDFTITGQPDAKAAAVSPPAVEYAKGKLLAPKTTTGPKGISIFLISDFGIGSLFGCASSIVASSQEPSATKFAKLLNCPMVLPLSPFALPSGKPVSEQYIFTNASSNARISSAIAFKNSAFFTPEIVLNSLKAVDAKLTASSISLDDASVKTVSLSLSNSGLYVLNVLFPLSDCELPM